MTRHLVLLPALGAVLLALGCGGGEPSVSGNVTYDGQPVAEGNVTFTPVDGAGTPFGAPIRNGSYQTDKATIGKFNVSVTAIERYEPGNPGPKGPNLIDGFDTGVRDLVPADAAGNMQPYEVVAGSQTHDIALMPPAK